MLIWRLEWTGAAECAERLDRWALHATASEARVAALALVGAGRPWVRVVVGEAEGAWMRDGAEAFPGRRELRVWRKGEPLPASAAVETADTPAGRRDVERLRAAVAAAASWGAARGLLSEADADLLVGTATVLARVPGRRDAG